MPVLEDFDLVCPCGAENFVRVTVRRAGHQPYVTDFVACAGCRIMYWLPKNAVTHDPEFKNDAAAAARSYKKPGRR